MQKINDDASYLCHTQPCCTLWLGIIPTVDAVLHRASFPVVLISSPFTTLHVIPDRSSRRARRSRPRSMLIHYEGGDPPFLQKRHQSTPSCFRGILNQNPIVLFVISLCLASVNAEGDLAADLPDKTIVKVFVWVLVVVLVCLSGLFAGLTLGYLGLDKIGLEIVMEAGDPEARRCAKRISPVRKDGNLLLCSLLFGNVAVNVLISILISDLTSGLVGFFASTLLIVLFGDIIPQALCSRFALQIGSRSVYVVRFIEFLLYPIAKPMAILLDMVLGEELGTIHSISELSKLLEIHVKHGQVDIEAGNILSGALHYTSVKVSQVMTALNDVYALSASDKLDFKTISQIFQSGFSRIPVYGVDRNDILGIMLTKDLILLDPDDATPVRNFLAMFGRRPEVMWPDSDLPTALRLFKQGKSHMALVRDVITENDADPYYVVRGIVTLEDVIEFILGDSISDETDEVIAPDNGLRLRIDRAVSDIGRLRLLDSTLRDEVLDPQEAKAVSSYLMGHIEPFQRIAEERGMTEAGTALTAVLEASPVLTLGGKGGGGGGGRTPCTIETDGGSGGGGGGEGRSAEDAAVYKKGKVATCCTVILNGRLTIFSGREGFQCQAGPWTVLGADAVTKDEGKYVPDFTALVPENGEPVRCIQISHTTFQKFLHPSSATNEAFEARLERFKQKHERARMLSREALNELDQPNIDLLERAKSGPASSLTSSSPISLRSLRNCSPALVKRSASNPRVRERLPPRCATPDSHYSMVDSLHSDPAAGGGGGGGGGAMRVFQRPLLGRKLIPNGESDRELSCLSRSDCVSSVASADDVGSEEGKIEVL